MDDKSKAAIEGRKLQEVIDKIERKYRKIMIEIWIVFGVAVVVMVSVKIYQCVT